jgi:serine protease
MKHYPDSKLFKYAKKAITLLVASVASTSIFATEIATSVEINIPNDALEVINVQSKFRSADVNRVIEGQYIVVLKDQYINQQVFMMAGQASINAANTTYYRRFAVENAATEMANRHNVKITKQYYAALSGFAAQMSEKDMRVLLADDRIAFIEQDQVMRANIVQDDATWGLDRIDQANLPLDSLYSYDADGSGVRTYIIDTGIFVSHNDFGDRAENGWDFVDNDNVANDCNGHGTHVAGIIGSSTYGVAKNVTLIALRVLDCNGSGSSSDVIAGIDWVSQNAVRPAIINMSLGGGPSSALDRSVQNAINNGITFVVAAGNTDSNACADSPGRVADALTVASSISTDARSSFSSWGSCVDLFAPGSSITSTWNNGGIRTASGTSMASPHVAGVAALYLQNNTAANPTTVNAAIINNAADGRIGDANGSPNRLLQSTFNGSAPPPPPPEDNILEKGIAETSLSGSAGREMNYTMEVPAGTANLNFSIRGGSGDADLYVRVGSAPTTSSYDCRPYRNGNVESCNFSAPQAGTYHIMLRAYRRYNGVALIGDYTVTNQSNGSFFENTTNVDIPDNGSTGVISNIDVVSDSSANTIKIAVDIKHTYIGDLIAEVLFPDGTKTVLHNRTGGSADNLIKTYTLDAGNRAAESTWKLKVRDLARSDVGYIDSWSVQFTQ